MEIIYQAIGALLVATLSGLASGAGICVLQLTDFLAEYSTIFNRLRKIDLEFSDRQEFMEWLANSAVDNNSLLQEFVFRLLSCPICLAVWFSGFFCIFTDLEHIWFLMAWGASVSIAVLVKVLIGKMMSS